MSEKEEFKNLLSMLNHPIKEGPETPFLCRYAHINDEEADLYVVTTFTEHGPLQVEIRPQWIPGPASGEMDIQKMSAEQLGNYENSVFEKCSMLARFVAVSPWIGEFLIKLANDEVNDIEAIKAEAELLLVRQQIMTDNGWNEILPGIPPIEDGSYESDLWMPPQGSES